MVCLIGNQYPPHKFACRITISGHSAHASSLSNRLKVEALFILPIRKQGFPFHQPRNTKCEKHESLKDEGPDRRYQLFAEIQRQDAKRYKRCEDSDTTRAVDAVTNALALRPILLVTQSEKKVRVDPEEDEEEKARSVVEVSGDRGSDLEHADGGRWLNARRARKDSDSESGNTAYERHEHVPLLVSFVRQQEQRNTEEQADEYISHVRMIVRADRIPYREILEQAAAEQTRKWQKHAEDSNQSAKCEVRNNEALIFVC